MLAAGSMDSLLNEPLLQESNDEQIERQTGYTADGTEALNNGSGSITYAARGGQSDDWGTFVQSMVANCVQGCRYLLGASWCVTPYKVLGGFQVYSCYFYQRKIYALEWFGGTHVCTLWT